MSDAEKLAIALELIQELLDALPWDGKSDAIADKASEFLEQFEEQA